MRRISILAFIVLALGAFAAACGGGSKTSTAQSITPIAGNSELVVGPNRLTIGLIDKDNNMISDAGGNSVHLQLFGPDGTLQSQADAHFVWAIQDVAGFWAANVSFDKAGNWSAQATLSGGGKQTTVKMPFPVLAKGSTPTVGDPAPPADNLTLSQNPNLKRLSTDSQPNMAFYQMTVTQALAAHQPFVVVFATPLFCQTQFCGPVLNNVKAVQPDFAGRVNFIHIEPYELNDNGELVLDEQSNRIPATPTNLWALQTEPWVFVVGADGKISSRFEGSASADELRASIQQALGG
jgi:hypothetical protein